MAKAADRCPIGSERVDESASRVNGCLTVLLLILSMLPGLRWVLVYLLADFGIKVFAGFAYSPNCFFARTAAQVVGLPVRMVAAAPKRFAGVVALVLIACTLVSAYGIAAPVAADVFTIVFAACAALEGFGGFCIGCWVYSLLPARFADAFVR